MKRFILQLRILTTILLIKTIQTKEFDDLLQVQIIFRHGDRTPNLLYPNDPYQNYTFKEGLGQLTARGKERMYRYGQVLKKRYNNFIETIPMAHIRARSTNSRRCLESCLVLLAGLFPPKAGQIWSSNEQVAHEWQPIAVETIDLQHDYLLNPMATCPQAEKHEQSINQIALVRKCLDDNKQFISEIEKQTGQQIKCWLDMATLYDTIQSERKYFGEQFKLPQWLHTMPNDTLARMYSIALLQVKTLIQSSSKYTKLRAGSFLKEMLSNLRNAVNQQEGTHSVYAYATHDITIMNILQAFGYFLEPPTYGSGIIVELRNQTEPQVHLYYANVKNNFDIRSLKEYKSLTELEASLQKYLITDNIKQECGL